jgi:hypothetical protein
VITWTRKNEPKTDLAFILSVRSRTSCRQNRKFPEPQNYFRKSNSHISHTCSQGSYTFAARRNRDYPLVYAHEIHACEVHAHQIHAHEVHAHEVHVHEVHACKMHVYFAIGLDLSCIECSWDYFWSRNCSQLQENRSIGSSLVTCE